jgi:hypothetical protein
MPSPLNYKVDSTLERKGAKFGLKLKDYSLKYFESVTIDVIKGAWTWLLFFAFYFRWI